MGRSISPMGEKTKTGSDRAAAPRLIVPMSLQPAIPRRVALQQSSPPLHQPGAILKEKGKFEKQKSWNGKCASSRLSQLRGSPQKPVLLKANVRRVYDCRTIALRVLSAEQPCDTKAVTSHGPAQQPALKTNTIPWNILCMRFCAVHVRGWLRWRRRGFDVGDSAIAYAESHC